MAAFICSLPADLKLILFFWLSYYFFTLSITSKTNDGFELRFSGDLLVLELLLLEELLLELELLSASSYFLFSSITWSEL